MSDSITDRQVLQGTLHKAPEVTHELVEHLQRTFPNKLPNYVPDQGTMGTFIGQQQVVDHLINLFRSQTSESS